ncbi:MAG: sigma-54 dependent transcriptional regulator [Desulfobacterales bacterium]|jgi:DNA-binding NtrC family response regulator|nr:sigma-54 dependent transcriptional regulator [Desulfobacterales bacterium]
MSEQTSSSWSAKFLSSKEGNKGKKLRTRLLVALVPSAVVILITTGLVTYHISTDYIGTALERFSLLHATTSAHALSSFMESCRQDLVLASRLRMNAEHMERYLVDIRESRGNEYAEFGYIDLKAGEHIVFVYNNENHVRIPIEMIGDIRPGPLHLYKHVKGLNRGEVAFVAFQEVDYPAPSDSNPHNRISQPIFRMTTPCFSENGQLQGYLYLAVDARLLRNILSLYESEQSPVFAVRRDPNLIRYSYFFDPDGWVLFQSEPTDQDHLPLSTLSARSFKRGTLGRPGMRAAFLPADSELRYWQMVRDILDGKSGLMQFKSRQQEPEAEDDYTLAYAPVYFKASPGRPQQVLGGVAFVDRSMLVVAAGYRHLDAMIIIVLHAALVMILLIIFVSHGISRDIMSLARALLELRSDGKLEAVDVRPKGYESRVTQDAINAMIETIKDQIELIRLKDLAIESVALQEPAELCGDWSLHEGITSRYPEIVGTGPLMEQLKRDIHKAGQVDVDVLIAGETGTGKQLAAEAIHRTSRRSKRPFISVNCGELDENLLLDTLFGHVKGAFTDSNDDRKGSFLLAHGGTLFLDEIQTASPKVQQALLRAISMRKIKPLGSDREIDVDIRLITATNADLNVLIQRGEFREDLYYRLKVITISPPPLREHRENIPLLAAHFLKDAEHMAGRQGLTFSKGFLERLMQYHWPGNIRELKNSIIKAAVMAERTIIQSDQLRIDAGVDRAQAAALPAPSSAAPDEISAPEGLNQRQVLAYRHVSRHGRIHRKEYQSLLGADVSRRTAIYDLQDMVAKGILLKVGVGPATSYVLPKEK